MTLTVQVVEEILEQEAEGQERSCDNKGNPPKVHGSMEGCDTIGLSGSG
jgi:hypothetical protein